MMAVAVFLHNQLQRKNEKEGGAGVRVGVRRVVGVGGLRGGREGEGVNKPSSRRN